MEHKEISKKLFEIVGNEDDLTLEKITKLAKMISREEGYFIDEDWSEKIKMIFVKLLQNTFNVTEFVLIRDENRVSSVCFSAKPISCECQHNCLEHIFGNLKFESHATQFSDGPFNGINTRVFKMTRVFDQSPICPLNACVKYVSYPVTPFVVKFECLDRWLGNLCKIRKIFGELLVNMFYPRYRPDVKLDKKLCDEFSNVFCPNIFNIVGNGKINSIVDFAKVCSSDSKKLITRTMLCTMTYGTDNIFLQICRNLKINNVEDFFSMLDVEYLMNNEYRTANMFYETIKYIIYETNRKTAPAHGDILIDKFSKAKICCEAIADEMYKLNLELVRCVLKYITRFSGQGVSMISIPLIYKKWFLSEEENELLLKSTQHLFFVGHETLYLNFDEVVQLIEERKAHFFDTSNPLIKPAIDREKIVVEYQTETVESEKLIDLNADCLVEVTNE